jgi:hypothetical protein
MLEAGVPRGSLGKRRDPASPVCTDRCQAQHRPRICVALVPGDGATPTLETCCLIVGWSSGLRWTIDQLARAARVPFAWHRIRRVRHALSPVPRQAQAVSVYRGNFGFHGNFWPLL